MSPGAMKSWPFTVTLRWRLDAGPSSRGGGRAPMGSSRRVGSTAVTAAATAPHFAVATKSDITGRGTVAPRPDLPAGRLRVGGPAVAGRTERLQHLVAVPVRLVGGRRGGPLVG